MLAIVCGLSAAEAWKIYQYGPDHPLSKKILKRKIRDSSLKKLKKKEQEKMMKKLFLEGYSKNAIADAFECLPETVTARIKRAEEDMNGTIFNDFLGLYTGEKPVGIHELIQKYDKHPVLMGLLSNMDSIIYVDVKKAMYEIYPLYKKYRHCALDDDAWKAIVQSAEALEKKWNGNLWVRRVILNLVNELDKESKELQSAAAGGNAENHASKAA